MAGRRKCQTACDERLPHRISAKTTILLQLLYHIPLLVTSSQTHSEFYLWNIARLVFYVSVNLLTPNDPYMGRTAPLTSKRCIIYIYSTNVGTEYFKHALYSPFFLSLFKMQFVS